VQRSAEGHLGGLQSALRGLAAAGGSGDHGGVATRRAEGWGMLGTGWGCGPGFFSNDCVML